MPTPRYIPTPEALQAIREWRITRKAGRHSRPYAKELCAKFGVCETTLRKVAAQEELA